MVLVGLDITAKDKMGVLPHSCFLPTADLVLVAEVEEDIEEIILLHHLLLVLAIQVFWLLVVVLVHMILRLVLMVVLVVLLAMMVVQHSMELDGVVLVEVDMVVQDLLTQMVVLVELEDLELLFLRL